MYQRNAACLHCGATFDQVGRGRARSWCFDCLPHRADASAVAYNRRASQLAVFLHVGRHGSCCSPPREPKPKPPVMPLPLCITCGLRPVRNRQALTCSAECKKERAKQVILIYRQTKRGQAVYLKAKRSDDRRRKRRKRTTVVERFDDEEIFERDRWICQLCGKRVRKGKTVPDPQAPTLDHIIPLSRDGEHTRANVQCAHFQCNVRKKTAACGSQLRLIG